MTAASPIKLRDGTWGARVRNTTVEPGDVIEITTQSGKAWTATVQRVLWSGDGVSLVATQSSTQSSKTSGSRGRGRGTWTGCSCGSVEEYGRKSDCASCRFDRDDC